MDPIIHLGCPGCANELQVQVGALRQLECSSCGQAPRLRLTSEVRAGGPVDACALCGHPDFYVQKDFNRTMGLVIVILGALASLVFFAREEAFLAMTALVATAVVDGAIYLVVGEVTVCYACHAIYRGFRRNPAHGGFDLETLERYGGRAPRL